MYNKTPQTGEDYLGNYKFLRAVPDALRAQDYEPDQDLLDLLARKTEDIGVQIAAKMPPHDDGSPKLWKDAAGNVYATFVAKDGRTSVTTDPPEDAATVQMGTVPSPPPPATTTTPAPTDGGGTGAATTAPSTP